MDIELLNTIKCDQGAVRAVRFNVDGSYCLSCGGDKKLKLWNPYRTLYLKTYGGHADEVTDACGSCDSSNIISCGADKTVILWDVATGQIIRRFRSHAGRVNCVKYNEESTVAVSGSHDSTIMCWDVKSRKNEPIQILKQAKDGITSVNVTDHEILAGSLDSYVRQYDIRMGKIIRDFIGGTIEDRKNLWFKLPVHINPVISASFTQDSQCIVVSSSNIIRLMDKETGELLSEFKGHTTHDYVIESCTNSKDQYIFSGSADGKMYSWEIISGKLSKLFPHPNVKTVHCISPHPTKNYFMTAGGNNIYLWGPTLTVEEEADDMD